MKYLEFIGICFAFLILSLMAILALDSLAFWDSTIISYEGTNGIQVHIAAAIEEKLVELTIAILVIFSIAATLFSGYFQKHLDDRVRKIEADLKEKALLSSRNSYASVTANIFHELAYQVFEKCEPTILDVWHGKEVDEDIVENTRNSIALGLHYTQQGLEYLASVDSSQESSERMKRVPGHLRNSFLWLSAAKVILSRRKDPFSCYSEHIDLKNELIAYLKSADTPNRPRWYQGYESCAFFLLVVGDEKGCEQSKAAYSEGLSLLRLATGISQPWIGAEPAPEGWRRDIKNEYKKAGYNL
ncbi:MAG: hypothetical protein CSA72_07130 [Rhodobacterales bacterium]|nr:MAG: hypothetical protein CSA72_07130 [Rhodobacterales bacterium]